MGSPKYPGGGVSPERCCAEGQHASHAPRRVETDGRGTLRCSPRLLVEHQQQCRTKCCQQYHMTPRLLRISLLCASLDLTPCNRGPCDLRDRRKGVDHPQEEHATGQAISFKTFFFVDHPARLFSFVPGGCRFHSTSSDFVDPLVDVPFILSGLLCSAYLWYITAVFVQQVQQQYQSGYLIITGRLPLPNGTNRATSVTGHTGHRSPVCGLLGGASLASCCREGW